ncbi:MAG TPA: outer membrane protein assembly factor BamD [Candidatus Omnitrophota bacterium]|nr:outer membrane protein assembly factor BamD [Candidatus Omnitrophota bacterium]HPT07071.1 outer membrane protein assembly factor BamD [Candidatus Omnitrophota bacterium]
MVKLTIMKRLIIILFIFFGLSATPAYPYWIWTPKTKKFINPKLQPKPTPQEQFEFAKGFFDIRNFEEARKEFQKLLSAYPKAFEAAESQYYLGRIDEALGKPYEAFLSYQKVVEKYPFSERIQEIIERQYKIGEAFMSGEKRKALGVTLPVENPSIEIFAKVIENSTYGPLAAKTQYKLGLVLKGLMRYYEAEEAFNKVISNYPDSEWVEASKFQIASCRAAVSRGPDYDQGAAQEAKGKFEEFIKEHPDAVLSTEAEKNIDQLRDKEAQSDFEIAALYEKQQEYKAAKIYYEGVIDTYPRSQWAAKAIERVQLMEKKMERKKK